MWGGGERAGRNRAVGKRCILKFQDTVLYFIVILLLLQVLKNLLVTEHCLNILVTSKKKIVQGHAFCQNSTLKFEKRQN